MSHASEISFDGDVGLIDDKVIIKRTFMKFERRKTLDGMKGFLVALILLFHMNVPMFSFGYIAVDAAFVLSGYISTSIIVREIFQSGELNLSRFYANRVKVLLPSSLIVVLTTCIVYKNMVGNELVLSHRNSFLAGSLFAENIYLAAVSNSFSSVANVSTPLMSYWALGIAEQFYVVLPSFLAFCICYWSLDAKKLSGVLAALIFGILCYYSISTRIHTSSAIFYGTFFRSYQLLAGSLLSILLFPHQATPDALTLYKGTALEGKECLIGNVLAFISSLALVAIATPAVASSFSPFAHGMIAVLFSMTLIFGLECCSGKRTRESSTNVMYAIFTYMWTDFLGTYSYVLYIWHYPLIIITKLLEIRRHKDGEFVSEIEFLVGLAFLSFFTKKLVQDPLKRIKVSDVNVLITAAMAVLVTMIAILLMTNVSHVLVVPVDHSGNVGVYQGSVLQNNRAQDKPVDFLSSAPSLPVVVLPPLSQNESEIQSKTTYLMIGDSTLTEWVDVVPLIEERHQISITITKLNLCPWIPGVFVPFETNLNGPSDRIRNGEANNCENIVGSFQNVMKNSLGRTVVFLEAFQILETFIQLEGTTLFPGDPGWIDHIETTIRKEISVGLKKNPELHLVVIEPHYYYSNQLRECYHGINFSADCWNIAPVSWPHSELVIAKYRQLALEFGNQFSTLSLNSLLVKDNNCVVTDRNMEKVYNIQTQIAQTFLATEFDQVENLVAPLL